MIIIALIRAMLINLVFPSFVSGACANRDAPPAIAAVAQDQSDSNGFAFVQTPLTHKGVRDFANSVREQLREAKTPAALAQREAYVKELVRLLKCCVVKDSLRHPSEGESSDEATRLSILNAARVVRLLGDLNAVEAVDALSERLLVPMDLLRGPGVPSGRRAGLPDFPTRWALFQIGDASLPSLRKRMTSECWHIRMAAADTAAYILGPRAKEEFQNWLAAAESVEIRERLEQCRAFFTSATAPAKSGNKLLTAEEYRKTTLERETKWLNQALDRAAIWDTPKDKAN